ncbi:MAG TPA: glycosyltransferase family 2 protein [Bacteroidales bacterium]|nr:glycosyltransferase family 2 protein [Bacteroidales bacterium]HOH84800.1 glycosyltransferase family 2 protein [Bacteroidales bacterium]HPB25416.1 glycosyltransferase family 2 protein [Bacteroidales bacterium]HPI31494.1 glycosyltransferase family 2 protein [Bacteroidales bacterium]HQN15731.1 glycosyltransferase family 2 protein [Bacteroidales bacterium]
MKAAVVILNWNGKKFLEQFLPAVIQHSKNIASIIVADNASSDDSVAFLKEHFPEIRIIQNQSNGGFAKGYNDALKLIDAEYYVLLNSDIEVTPGWIEPVLGLMDSDKSIAACQPKIRSYHEREKFEYAGAAGGYIDKYGYPFCRGRLFFTIEEDEGQYNDTREIFWATGACLFVRAELYHKLGGLDEDFFAHMEEIDFCWRLKNHGYKIMYCPDSIVFHIGGGTLPKSSSRKTYLNFRNNFTLLYKNLPAKRLAPVFTARLLLDGIAAIKFLLDGGFKDFIAVSRAHLSFYRNIGKIRKKRKLQIQQKVRHIYHGNIVVDYYLLKRKKFTDLKKKIY